MDVQAYAERLLRRSEEWLERAVEDEAAGAREAAALDLSYALSDEARAQRWFRGVTR